MTEPHVTRDAADEAMQPEQGANLRSVAIIAFIWSAFQMWYASPFNVGVIVDVPARAIHLGFALVLCFLLFRSTKSNRAPDPTPLDYVLLALGAFSTLYLWVMYDNLAERPGIPLIVEMGGFSVPVEFIVGAIGLFVLLEATRRSIGIPLVIVCSLFFLYSIFGQSMPELISHKGMSPERLVNYHWFGGEAVFGMALDVSLSPIFLFVLFGALLERAGAGHYFLQLAFSLVGRLRGGPAKASILASGMTGMISGSSVANTVTTGNFTIPIMKKTGMPASKAGAIEVAASVNGQIMPPIMGAAAFVMAEFIGISYFDVIYHAFLPAVIAYLGLLYISHLEALKLNLRPMDEADIPRAWSTFIGGIYYLIPIALLVYLMLVERRTPDTSVFYAILLLVAIMVVRNLVILGSEVSLNDKLRLTVADIFHGFVNGARNMANVAVAIGAAGIVVGAVSSTGLSNALVGFVEAISGGNIIILLVLTAVLCLLLGLGLPTTANYLVVASILAPVVVEVGSAAGLVVPLIVIHLFVFYYGLMADVTPPVGLAAYAASAISRADPISTGVQAFMYEIRTAVLPFMFVFNTQLVMIGVTSFAHGLFIFITSLLAVFAFASITQRWLLVRLSYLEIAGLALAMALLFRPDFFLNQVSPEYSPIDPLTLAEQPVALEEEQTVRFRILRETPYGDRRRMLIFSGEELNGQASFESMGLTIAQVGDDQFEISETRFLGPAESKGADPLDQILSSEVSNLNRPSQHWFGALGLLVFGLVFGSQMMRARREEATGKPAGQLAE